MSTRRGFEPTPLCVGDRVRTRTGKVIWTVSAIRGPRARLVRNDAPLPQHATRRVAIQDLRRVGAHPIKKEAHQ